MKTTRIMLLGAAVLAAGSAVYALSTPGSKQIKGGYCKGLAEKANDKKGVHKAPATPQRAAEGEGDLYIVTAQSVFNEQGQFDYYNGKTVTFPTRINIDGENATISTLVDYHTGELEMEYPVSGTYDSRRDIITIEKASSLTVTLAELWDEATYSDISLALYAGDVREDGQITGKSELNFSLQEDGSWVSQCGYGAYDLYYDGFYQVYKSVKMTLPAQGVDINFTGGNVDLTSTFVCAGLAVEGTVTLFNSGDTAGDYTITSSTSELTVGIPEGSVGACESIAVPFTLTPTQPGEFEGTLTLEAEGIGTKTVTVKASVNPRPDYALITCEGSAPFETVLDPVYPFLITEVDGRTVAMSSNDGHEWTTSALTCLVEIEEGQTGVFSWNAEMRAQRPNSFKVIVDGEWYMYEATLTNTDPYDMSGTCALAEGHHEIQFVLGCNANWYDYGLVTNAYVWNLNLDVQGAKPHDAQLVDGNCDFGTTYFDLLPVPMQASVKVLNTGTEALSILAVEGEGNFSGTVPTISVPQGGEIEVPMSWIATGVGTDAADVTISTTGGDLTVHCSGVSEALPYDYKPIVKEGEFSFNTGIEWPFLMSEGNTYAYNSTAKAQINGITYSWLRATFEVPEGKVYGLDWTAFNDSEDLFVMMDIPSLISGTIISIDGGEEQYIGGIGANASADALYSPEQLLFEEGVHEVLFKFKKTDDEERWIFGDDCLHLSTLALTDMSSVGEVKAVATVATEWYTADGVRLAAPVRGLNIRVDRLEDGNTLTSKVMVK